MPSDNIFEIAVVSVLVVVGVLGLATTLRAHRSLQRTRARFVSVLDAVGFGVLLLNEDGTVQYVNSVGTDILRRPLTEIIGKHFHRLLHEEAVIDEPGSPCGFDAAMRARRAFRGQEHFADGYGRTIPVTVTGTPVAEDRHRMVIAFRDRSTDIIQVRQREEAFALISHEIRSPLTALVGYSARLRAAVASGALDVDPQRAEEIALLAREANRMREIILLILGMAEIERGRLDVEVEPIRMTQLIHAEVGRVHLDRPTARFNVDAVEVVVESDERYVRRIVHNLLENAAKYGGDLEPVDVTLRPQDDGGCRLAVRDHGSGIPPEAQSHIFERFYRHESAASHGKGLGLGLYLSRRLAVRLGGHLTFTSTSGQGAEFSLTLPPICPDVTTPEPGDGFEVDSMFPMAGPTQN